MSRLKAVFLFQGYPLIREIPLLQIRPCKLLLHNTASSPYNQFMASDQTAQVLFRCDINGGGGGCGVLVPGG